MKFCTQCHRTPWPYLFALGIALFAALLTWLTLDFAEVRGELKAVATAGMFLVAASILTMQVTSCLARHCKHEEQHAAHLHRS